MQRVSPLLKFRCSAKTRCNYKTCRTFSNFVFYPTLPPRKGRANAVQTFYRLLASYPMSWIHHWSPPSFGAVVCTKCLCKHLRQCCTTIQKGQGGWEFFNPPIYLWLSLQPKWPQGMRCYSTSIPFHFVLHVYQSMLLFQNIQQLRVLPHPPSKKGQSKRSANLLSLACQLSHELDPSLVTTFIWCCCLHQMSLQASAPMLHHP